MKKIFLLIPLFFVPFFISAQSLDNIEYPIEELGNCENRQECKLFCDKIGNLESCFNFSKKHNLLAQCDLDDARRFLNALKKGINLLPCETKAECLDFCSKPENLDQCLVFSQETGIISRDQALLIKRTAGLGPGQCKNHEDCKNYCSEENNVDECLAFALEHGFISQSQAAEAIRIRDIALQGGPGECVGLKQCRDYCSVSDNFQECINFGKETGIITEERVEEIKEFIEQGGPGGCKTRQECNEYCQDPENIKQCLEFMIEEGYLPKESIEVMENKIKEAEQAIYQQIQDYKQNFDIDIDDEEIKKQIEEILQPYEDILKKESSSNSARSIAQRIKKERGFNNILTSTTRIIAQGIKNSAARQTKPSNLVKIFNSFFANIAQRILNKYEMD
ncbi:hypothetical protein AMJ47_04035 [Parcubacteria bacterium DG_72]|nr:MAG: hypothetical protein AMJ47_04035 [Parcubacteria bacterium DG_72]